MQTVFAMTPSALRKGRRTKEVAEVGVVTLRLPYREPMNLTALLDFLGAHAIAGLEEYVDGVFTRVIDAPSGPALVSMQDGSGAVQCRVRLSDTRDLVTVVARVRRLLDLDADPVAVDGVLAGDPHLAPLILKRPGLRAPGSVDGFETAIRTVVGQQISVAGARTVTGRIVAELGRPAFDGEPWRLFPTPAALAENAVLPMPKARTRTVHAIAAASADDGLALDPGADRDLTRVALLDLPGVGPWTADYLAMRALGDPDVLLTSDLAVRHAADDLGLELAGGRPDWAPWRSYATCHLWAHLYADIWSAAS
jgi:AraC family transcriptional regulator of adaptative response / DNA-3-methyladenine glycosylase II